MRLQSRPLAKHRWRHAGTAGTLSEEDDIIALVGVHGVVHDEVSNSLSLCGGSGNLEKRPAILHAPAGKVKW